MLALDFYHHSPIKGIKADSRTEQEICKTRPEHLVVPESKEVGIYQSDTGATPRRPPNGQTRKNVSNKINKVRTGI